MPQDNCLQQEAGAGIRYMVFFDQMLPRDRHRIAQSPYNLCVACVNDFADFFSNRPDPIATAIEFMEDRIRQA